MDRTAPVWSLIRAWEICDLDLMMEQLSDDAVFENVPMDPIVGKEAIRAATAAHMALCHRAPHAFERFGRASLRQAARALIHQPGHNFGLFETLTEIR